MVAGAGNVDCSTADDVGSIVYDFVMVRHLEDKGPPGDSATISVRLPRELHEAVDRFMAQHEATTAEAVRRLLALGIEAEGRHA